MQEQKRFLIRALIGGAAGVAPFDDSDVNISTILFV